MSLRTLSSVDPHHECLISDIGPKVTIGQGEYVVFQQDTDHQPRQIDDSIFAKVYRIFQTYTATNCMSYEGIISYSKRHILIQRDVKALDPSLEVMFVPRTLYELLFIQTILQEEYDQSEKRFFSERAPGSSSEPQSEPRKENRMISLINEWNGPSYIYRLTNPHDPSLVDIAYEMNNILIKTLSPKASGFTLSEHLTTATEVVKYLSSYSELGCDGGLGDLVNEPTGLIISEGPSAPSLSFGRSEKWRQLRRQKGVFAWESIPILGWIKERFDRGCLYSDKTPLLAVSEPRHEEIIFRAIKLDCCELAKTHVFIFRGGDLRTDSVLSSVDTIHTLSFGYGLFSGVVSDPGGTAWTFMRASFNDAYAIPIAIDRIRQSPFYIPPGNTLLQLLSYGETFHPRTKIPRSSFERAGRIGGIDMLKMERLAKSYGMEIMSLIKRRAMHLICDDMSTRHLAVEFDLYKESAIPLMEKKW